jgi:hypothetical protein
MFASDEASTNSAESPEQAATTTRPFFDMLSLQGQQNGDQDRKAGVAERPPIHFGPKSTHCEHNV